jgi:biotin operon repressor
MREEKLLAYLKGACTGRRYTVRSAELEQVLGVSSTDLRKLINRLRRKGIPIGSCPEGYYYARTAGEVYSTIRQLRGMVNGLEAAIHGLEQSLDAFEPGGDSHS